LKVKVHGKKEVIAHLGTLSRYFFPGKLEKTKKKMTKQEQLRF